MYRSNAQRTTPKLLGLLTISCWAYYTTCGLQGQCVDKSCQPAGGIHPAVVRVMNTSASGCRAYGSGTLVHVDADQGIVLTCAHLFRGGAGHVTVTFADRQSYEARLLSADISSDLAALSITRPSTVPVVIAESAPRPGEPVSSCGYGSDGRYWCNRGNALGYARTDVSSRYETLTISGTARDGDSGGPVLNRHGQLVAVLWGTDGRTVESTYCGRIRTFLARLFPKRPQTQTAPLVPVLPRSEDAIPPRDKFTPNGKTPGTMPPILAEHLDKIRKRLGELSVTQTQTRRELDTDRSNAQHRFEKIEKTFSLIDGLKDRVDRTETSVSKDRLHSIVREALSSVAVENSPGLIEQVLPTLLTALGWTGPPSLAAIIALRMAIGLIRRRAAQRSIRHSKNEASVPDQSTHEPATSNPSTVSARTGTGPWNDDYAEQLARVYALSGRSPMGDLTLGREYDEALRQAEESSDGALSSWAQRIRHKVAQRFYRIHGMSPTPADPIS